MVREPHERPGPFSRRDAIRLVVAALLIVVALAAGVVSDLAPVNPGYGVGVVAKNDIVAPRGATIDNPIETTAAQEAAAKAVPPQYDFTQARAASIAAVQVADLQAALKPIDTAFGSPLSSDARRIALENALPNALPSLGADNRTILLTLDQSRWPLVERAAEDALSAGEQVELRDTELALKQSGLAAQYIAPALGLSPAETQLASAIATPLYVANSAYSATLTQQAQDRAAAATPAVQDQVRAGEVIVDQGHVIDAAAMVKIRYFGLDQSTVDWGRPAAWMLLGTVVAALMLGWLWRFRPEYWARSRTLILIGLIFVLSVLAMKLPGGRAWVPYVMPTAAAGMLLTLLLDFGRRHHHGGVAGGPRRSRERLVGRVDRVRPAERHRRNRGHSQGRAATFLRPGRSRRRRRRGGRDRCLHFAR